MNAKDGFVTINSVSTQIIQFGLSDLITQLNLNPTNENEQCFLNEVSQCDAIVVLISGKNIFVIKLKFINLFDLGNSGAIDYYRDLMPQRHTNLKFPVVGISQLLVTVRQPNYIIPSIAIELIYT